MFESFFGAKKNQDWKAPKAQPKEKLPTDESALQYPPGDIRNKMVSTVTTSDEYHPGWDANRQEEEVIAKEWDQRLRTGGPSDNTQSGTREAFAKLKHEVDMTDAIELPPENNDDEMEIEQISNRHNKAA